MTNQELVGKSKFFIAGYFDAQRNDPPQHNTRPEHTEYFVEYMEGYTAGGKGGN